MTVLLHPDATDGARAALERWRSTAVGEGAERSPSTWLVRRGATGTVLTTVELESKCGAIWFDIVAGEIITVDWRARGRWPVDMSNDALCSALDDLGSELGALERELETVEEVLGETTRPCGLRQRDDARLVLFEKFETAATFASDVACGVDTAAYDLHGRESAFASKRYAWPDSAPDEEPPLVDADDGGKVIGLPPRLLEIVPGEARSFIRFLGQTSMRAAATKAHRTAKPVRWSRGRRSIAAAWEAASGMRMTLDAPGESRDGVWQPRPVPETFEERVTDALDRYLREWRRALADAEHLAEAVRCCCVAPEAPYWEVLGPLEEMVAAAEAAILREADELFVLATPAAVDPTGGSTSR